jgi:hypothetical protein
MDEEQQEGHRREPKISLVEGILITILMALVDIAELIPFLGDTLGLFIGALATIYLLIKGVNGIFFIIGAVADLVPFLQELPFKTAGWLITWGIDHFATGEVAGAIVEKAEKVGELAEGNAEGAASEAAAAGAGAAEGAAAQAGSAATQEAGAAEGALKAEGEAAQAQEGGRPSDRVGKDKELSRGEGGAESAGEGPEGGEGTTIEPEALGEERQMLGQEGQLRKELLEETPGAGGAPETTGEKPAKKETEEEKKAREMKERAKKLKERMDRFRPQPQGEPQEGQPQGEEDEEELPRAA